MESQPQTLDKSDDNSFSESFIVHINLKLFAFVGILLE